MTAPAPLSTGINLNLIEAGLTLIAVFGALAFPRLGSKVFARAERSFRRLALRMEIVVIRPKANARNP